MPKKYHNNTRFSGEFENVIKLYPDLDVDTIDLSGYPLDQSRVRIANSQEPPFDWQNDPEYSTNNTSTKYNNSDENSNHLSTQSPGSLSFLPSNIIVNYIQESPYQEPPTPQS